MPDKRVLLKISVLISQPKHYVVGTQKNHLNETAHNTAHETVLLNFQNYIIILVSRRYATNQFIKCTCLVKRQETALSSVVKRSFNFSLCSGKP